MRQFKRISVRIISFLLLVMLGVMLPVASSFAEGYYFQNKENGNRIVLEDDANLFTEDEASLLLRQMTNLTPYGHIIVKTIDDNPYNRAATYAENFYHDHVHQMSGTMFLIDMDTREIYIFSDGENFKRLTKRKALSITDNIYRQATNGNYYACVSKGLSQCQTILEGGKIAEPMRYITTGLLSILIAMLINFIIVRTVSRVRDAKGYTLVQAAATDLQVEEPDVRFISESRTYSPVSSGSSGGHSGGRSSGGGHSGGGHSGGGGGHHF